MVDPATGETVPLGTSGELMVRGYNVMHGYWDDPEKNSQTISQDRWYRTGYVYLKEKIQRHVARIVALLGNVVSSLHVV